MSNFSKTPYSFQDDTLRRRLFTFCSALSLLLCVGVIVLWVRSYWRYDSVAVVDNTVEPERDHGVLWRSYTVSSGRGVLRLAVEDHEMRMRLDEAWPAPRPAWEFRRSSRNPWPQFDLTQGRGWLGISSGSNFGGGSGGSFLTRYLTVPHWAVASATAVLATALMKRGHSQRARQRHREGRCPACG